MFKSLILNLIFNIQLPRVDVSYDVRFYVQAERLDDGSGRASWTGGQEVLAVAYDVMIPGYHTKTTNNLRLWESRPKRGFDLNSFNGQDNGLHLITLTDYHHHSWKLREGSGVLE